MRTRRHRRPVLKPIEDATDIRRLLLAFGRAEITAEEAERRRLLTCVVVGGGPTGVELAGAMVELARHAMPGEFRRIDPAQARIVLIEAEGSMAIAAASEALVRHLRARLAAGGEDWPLEAMTLPEARTRPGHGIALVLWRVQPDEPAGDTSPLRTASKGDPPEGVGLTLRYLLVVRGTDAATEQTMIGRCMAVLDRHPVVEEPGSPANLAPEALVVAVETPSDDAYLRLAAAGGDPPPLLVPYAVRSVRLRPPVAGHIPDTPPGTDPPT